VRQTYAKPREQVEKDIVEWYGPDDKTFVSVVSKKLPKSNFEEPRSSTSGASAPYRPKENTLPKSDLALIKDFAHGAGTQSTTSKAPKLPKLDFEEPRSRASITPKPTPKTFSLGALKNKSHETGQNKQELKAFLDEIFAGKKEEKKAQEQKKDDNLEVKPVEKTPVDKTHQQLKDLLQVKLDD